MTTRGFSVRVFLISLVPHCAASLVGCAHEPSSTAECQNPCKPDIEVVFETPLEPGRHDFVFTIDGEETACSAHLQENEQGDLTPDSDCTSLGLYISETAISFWTSPDQVEIEHESPSGCRADLAIEPTYEDRYSATCDITCTEATGTYELPSCDDGMGASGGAGGAKDD